MRVVTLLHADGPPLVVGYWHPIAWTSALAQSRHRRAMARIDGVSSTCGDELPDHVPANREDCGGAGAVGTANQELSARLRSHMRALVGTSGLVRTVKGRGWTIVLAFPASARDLAARWCVLDADAVTDTGTRARGVDTGKPVPDRGPVALKKAGVGPPQALVARHSPTGRAGCGPGQGAVCSGAVPRTRRAGPARGRRLEGHLGVAGRRACSNGGVLADPALCAPDFVGPHCRG